MFRAFKNLSDGSFEHPSAFYCVMLRRKFGVGKTSYVERLWLVTTGSFCIYIYFHSLEKVLRLSDLVPTLDLLVLTFLTFELLREFDDKKKLLREFLLAQFLLTN